MSTSVLDRPKVFCIGFQNTGTASLETALQVLGYNVTGPDEFRPRRIRRFHRKFCADLSYQADAFFGNPWPVVFRDMLTLWPNAKFILTVRNTSDWINSVLSNFDDKDARMRRFIYGTPDPVGNEQVYKDRYNRHIDDVTTFFASHPNQLLTLDVTKGEGYEKLCPFLGKAKPALAFPCKGVTEVPLPIAV